MVGKIIVLAEEGEAMRTALKLACHKADRCQCDVDLLAVVAPPYGQFASVAEAMRQEKYEAAQGFLKTLADEAEAICGTRPGMMVREGVLEDQLMAAVEEDPAVDLVVVSATTVLESKLYKKLTVPLMVVPGNLTDQQIEELP